MVIQKRFLLLFNEFVFYNKKLMEKLTSFLTIVLLTIFSSCENPIDEEQLLGSWTAIEFLEGNTPMDVDLKSINFSFYDNNTYTYQGLMYKEAGKYYIERNLLFSTDTLADQRIKKSVKIIKSTPDSLFFEMNEGGITKIIKLLKTQ